MKILLVNDDGIKSPRLQHARNILSKYGNVVTVAPIEEQSGKSASISLGKIKYKVIKDDFYGIDGTPADCVTFGIFGLHFKPDLVISGINRGYNVGVDAMYSGTVGAAMQACHFGFKAIAFSADYTGETNMKKYFERVFNHIIQEELAANEYILNVNLPKDEFQEDKGIEITTIHYPQIDMITELKEGYFYHQRQLVDTSYPKHTDMNAKDHGITSITKIYLK